MANRTESYTYGQLLFGEKFGLDETTRLLDVMTMDASFFPSAFELRLRYKQSPMWLFTVRASRYDDFCELARLAISGTSVRYIRPNLHSTFRPPVTHAYDVTLSHREFSVNQDKVETLAQYLTAGAGGVLLEDEEIVVQCSLGGTFPARKFGGHLINPDKVTLLGKMLGVVPEADEDMVKACESRYLNNGFLLNIRVGVITESDARAEIIRRVIDRCLATVSTKHTKVRLGDKHIAPKDIDLITTPRKDCLNMCAKELLGFLAWPMNKMAVLNSAPSHPKLLAVPTGYGCKADEAFGISADDHNPTYVNTLPENYSRHMLISGRSGGGKSTLALAHAVKLANSGDSLLIIDPKGDFRQKLFARINPTIATKAKIVDINLADELGCIVGINPFSPIWRLGADPEAVADNITAAIEKAAGGYWGGMMTDVLSCAIKTLAYYVERPTIPMLVPLLTDAEFRKPIVDKVMRKDPYGLGAFWKNYEAIGKVGQSKTTESSMRRLREFTTRNSLRAMLGVPEPKFDLTELFDPSQQVIVVATCNSGASGPHVPSLLGSLITSQVWSTAQAQSRLPEAERKRVHLIVDEAGDNINTNMDFETMCAQARGYNLCLVLICQYKEQLGGAVTSVETNVATHISFGSNRPKDCSEMATQFGGGLEAADFQELPMHHFYMHTEFYGRKVTMLGKTLPSRGAVNSPRKIMDSSRSEYAMPKSEIIHGAFGMAEQNEKAEQLLELLKGGSDE